MTPRSLKKEKYHHFEEYTAKELSRTRFTVTGPHRFTLNLLEPGKWRVSGRSLTGSYMRLILYTRELGDALEMALTELFGHKTGDPRDMSLADAFIQWDKGKSIRPVTREGYRDATRRFLEWTDAHRITTLGDLKRSHLLQYLAGMEGLEYHTKVNRWKPIRAMIIWASEEHPGVIHDIRHGVKIRDTSPAYPDNLRPFLFEKVCEFLLWLRSQPIGWRIIPGIALQTLAGLRMTEAHRILWSSIDIAGGTITIQGEVKVKASVRTIPVAGLVLDILSEAPRSGKRVLSDYRDPDGYAKAVERHLKRWGQAGKIKVTDFRKTLESEATRRGWKGYIFNRYCGRAPRRDDVQAQSYIAVGEDLPNLFRDQVVNKLDEVLEPFRREWNTPCEKVVPLRKEGV